MPGTAASAGSRSTSARVPPGRSLPYEVEFSLTSTSSRTPCPASQAASPRTSRGGRETNEPRNDGIAQNAQRRSQPEASLSGAYGLSESRTRERSGTQAWPGTATSTAAAGRCAGEIGSRVRRSTGTCGAGAWPPSTSARRSASSG